MSEIPRYLCVKAQHAILSADHERQATILIDRLTGKIIEVTTGDIKSKVEQIDVETIELEEGQVLMPGLVDAHGKGGHFLLCFYLCSLL